ncbi:MAG TPA: bifunctional riboflavin kinase/FAD synthetase [Ignavibacteriaceae bacterium]|nr:bifunctional riboflavin kinase/FAD synthetase [Ignavibacteriaceae bacterium]
MSLYQNLSETTRNDNSIITVGSFDGVHVGHAKILFTLVNRAKERNCRSVLLTFEPHPRKVVSKDFDLRLLTSTDEKKRLISRLGVDEILVIPFTKEFSQMSSDDFFNEFIIKKIGIKEIILGYDHRFGKGRDGDENKVRELGKLFGFDVITVPPVKFGDLTVSSSLIRKELAEGRVKNISDYLNRYYSITGSVSEGDKRGRLLGFPTANISVSDSDKMIPSNGVYAVRVIIGDETFKGVMNIGKRPTFQSIESTILEVNIFDFEKNIYGREIMVEFIDRLRDEQKFSSKDELIAQIEKDKKRALEILTN